MTVMADTAYVMTGSRDLACGMSALLLSIPPLRRVERLPRPDVVLDRLTAARPPVLVVLDTDQMGEAAPDVVQTVVAIAPETRYLVLSNTIAESRALASSGIGPVVVKGEDPAILVGAIERLLGGAA